MSQPTTTVQKSRFVKARPVVKSLLIFLLGMVIGGGIVFQFSWGIMASLMGVQAQTGYRAVDASGDAYWLSSILSHQRLGEHDKARERAEWLLDVKTIEAASGAKAAKDPRIKKVVSGQLGIVKRYRKIHPSQTEIKDLVGRELAAVPDLPEPKPNLPAHKLTAQGRLYQQYRNRKPAPKTE